MVEKVFGAFHDLINPSKEQYKEAEFSEETDGASTAARTESNMPHSFAYLF